MRGPWRAILALALHIGFFALPTGTVVGLLGVTALTYRADSRSGLSVAAVTIVLAVLFALGLRAVLRIRPQPRGVSVTKSAQPQVWKMAESIASAAESKPPKQIRVTSEPSARIRQDTSLLGLRGRGYSLEIGLPLLAGLNASELNGVVAREIGHLVGRGKLTAVTHRISTSIEHTMANLTGGPTKWLFAGYARLHTRMSASTNYALELDAAALAVRIAGKRPAITAVRKMAAIESGWREYAEKYLTMATSIEYTPDVLLGFRSFLDHPERKPELADSAKQAIADERPPGTGQRPTRRECVEMMKRLSGPEREEDSRPAFSLLRNPRKSVPALEDQLMIDGLGPRTPWSELAEMAGAAHVAQQAAKLSSSVSQSGVGQEPAIGAILAAIHRGESQELINPVLDPGLDPDRMDEAVTDTLTELLAGSVIDALVLSGHAQHELNWAGASHVRLGNGQLLDPDQLVRPAVLDPGLIPGLHRALVNLGVPLNHSREPAAEPVPTLAGIVSTVEYSRRRYELLVTDRGLLLVPSRRGTFRRLFAGALARLYRAERTRLAELAATPLNELREASGAQWIDSRDIASAALEQRRRGWSLRLELYLDTYSMSSLDIVGSDSGEETTAIRVDGTQDSEEKGDPYSGLEEVMGARMSLDGTGAGRDE